MGSHVACPQGMETLPANAPAAGAAGSLSAVLAFQATQMTYCPSDVEWLS